MAAGKKSFDFDLENEEGGESLFFPRPRFQDLGQMMMMKGGRSLLGGGGGKKKS